MDYDKIIIELLNRIVILEEKVSNLESMNASAQSQTSESLSGSKKYRFLSDYLHESNELRVKLTYEQIEDILKFKLPESAITHRAFWANTTSHSIALSWLSVNYEVVEANLDDKYVVFEKTREFETMKKGKSIMTEESHLRICKNYAMITLYKKLKESVFKDFDDAGIGATSSYVYWNISGIKRTRQFANFYIQKDKIRILTLTPTSNHNIGEAVPDTHLWVLNYQTDISSETDIDEIKGILLESYNQIKQLI